MNMDEPILLVEDDTVDAMTVKRALREIDVPNPLAHVTNGEEALDYLRNSDNPTPCIILLDINMPKMNGIEFLKIAKQEGNLQCIPVVVLTTSSNDRDILQTFNLSVAGYMLKPVDYEQFVETMRVIDSYWKLSKMPLHS